LLDPTSTLRSVFTHGLARVATTPPDVYHDPVGSTITE
jgi:hypothetical protein